MHRTFVIAIAAIAWPVAILAAEKPVKMADLPAAVQKAVQQETKGATIKELSKEVEDGKTLYEVETVVDGKGRDVSFDSTGAVVEVEEEVPLESIPAPARAAIEKQAGAGKITKVEKVTKGQALSYEAAVTKGSKKSEIVVKADGSPAK